MNEEGRMQNEETPQGRPVAGFFFHSSFFIFNSSFE
jgi:hypothetical protein